MLNWDKKSTQSVTIHDEDGTGFDNSELLEED